MLSMRTALAESLAVHLFVFGLLCLLPAWVYLRVTDWHAVSQSVEVEICPPQSRVDPPVEQPVEHKPVVAMHETARRIRTMDTAFARPQPPHPVDSENKAGTETPPEVVPGGGSMTTDTPSADKGIPQYTFGWGMPVVKSTTDLTQYLGTMERGIQVALDSQVRAPISSGPVSSRWQCKIDKTGKIHALKKVSGNAPAEVDEQIERVVNSMPNFQPPANTPEITVGFEYEPISKKHEVSNTQAIYGAAAITDAHVATQSRENEYVQSMGSKLSKLFGPAKNPVPNSATDASFKVELDEHGTVLGVECIKSSGFQFVDLEAMHGIGLAGPYGELPRGKTRLVAMVTYMPLHFDVGTKVPENQPAVVENKAEPDFGGTYTATEPKNRNAASLSERWSLPASQFSEATSNFGGAVEMDIVNGLFLAAHDIFETNPRARGVSSWEIQVGLDGKIVQIQKVSSKASAAVDREVERALMALKPFAPCKTQKGPPLTFHIDYKARLEKPTRIATTHGAQIEPAEELPMPRWAGP
jgi:hypothetical protein